MKTCFAWIGNKRENKDIREHLNMETEDVECAFCLNNVNNTDNITITCCKHAYHAECWTAYVFFISKRQKLAEIRCPTCRNDSTGRLIHTILKMKNSQ